MFTELGYYAIEHDGKSYQVVVEENQTGEDAFFNFDNGQSWEVPAGHRFLRTPMGLPICILAPEEFGRLVFIAPMQA